MAGKSIVMLFGMGTDVSEGDYSRAAVRAIESTVGQAKLEVVDAFGVSRDQMHVGIVIGVQRPEKVDKELVAAAFPHDRVDVRVEEGGLDLASDSVPAIMANAVVTIYLDLPNSEVGGDAQ